MDAGASSFWSALWHSGSSSPGLASVPLSGFSSQLGLSAGQFLGAPFGADPRRERVCQMHNWSTQAHGCPNSEPADISSSAQGDAMIDIGLEA